MKFERKTEYFVFDAPLDEPNIVWNANDDFRTSREESANGEIVWFGHSINWRKEPNGSWQVLSINENAIPLEKYLPELMYGGDRLIWVDCDTPLYEQLYLESLFNSGGGQPDLSED
jgi:hypothetical protein